MYISVNEIFGFSDTYGNNLISIEEKKLLKKKTLMQKN